MTNPINNTKDIIDSRDVIARIEELESNRDAAAESEEEWDESEQDELKALLALAEEASGYAPDWEYGEALIRDSYFQEYAQELAEDCGMIQDNASWPYTCIDWERAAKELQYDYSAVDFDGVTYWIR